MARQGQKNSKEWRMGKADFMSITPIGRTGFLIYIYIYTYIINMYSIVFIARWSVHPSVYPTVFVFSTSKRH